MPLCRRWRWAALTSLELFRLKPPPIPLEYERCSRRAFGKPEPEPGPELEPEPEPGPELELELELELEPELELELEAWGMTLALWNPPSGRNLFHLKRPLRHPRLRHHRQLERRKKAQTLQQVASFSFEWTWK